MFDTLINYVFLFFFFSIIGWTIESTYRSIGELKIINSGFLNGPLCPIYGFGCLLFHICLVPIAEPVEKRFWLVILLGVLLTDSLEYITSYLMEKLFHARWWDYSNNFLNINGRICFKHSCYWAIFAFAYTYIIAPFYAFLMGFVSQKLRTAAVIAIIIIFLVDLALTLKAAMDINKLMTKLSSFKQSLLYAAEVIRSKAENLKDSAENRYEKLMSSGDRAAEWKQEKTSQLYDIKASYEKLKSAGGRSSRHLISTSRALKKNADDTITDIERVWNEIKAKFKNDDSEMM